MDILSIVGFGLVATVIVMTLQVHRPEIAMQISIVAGVIMCVLLMKKISAILELIFSYFNKVDVQTSYLTALLKIIIVAYIVEFASSICSDAGQASIASKIELAGKITVVMMAIPIVTSMLDLVVSMMP